MTSHDPFLDPPEDRPGAPASALMDPLLNIPGAITSCALIVGVYSLIPVVKTGLRIQRAFA